jgi:hypothetical protein
VLDAQKAAEKHMEKSEQTLLKSMKDIQQNGEYDKKESEH